MDKTLPAIELGASREDAELTVILMHGLGADGHDFADVGEAYAVAAEPRKWRFVLPHAPAIPVTINQGMVMPAWYDILDMIQPREVDWGTVAASRASVESLLAAELAPKVVLAGFSQGAAMALDVGLRNQERVAGILVMSGYLLESETQPCPAKTAADFPIGMFHGSADPMVRLAAAEGAAATLESKGYSASLKIYPDVEHSLCEEEVRDVFAWLEEVAG